MKDVINEDKNYLLEVYKRLPIEIKKGRKEYIIDINNKRYLDMFSGIAVNSLGHCNRIINKAMKSQIRKHTHLSNYFVNEEVVDLAKHLIEASNMGKVFFTNSGTEANEAAIKLVRKKGKEINVNKTDIITLKDSFHGRTIGSLSLTGQVAKKQIFAPLMGKVIHVNRNDRIDLRKKVSDKTCAIFLELIQGESGVNLLDNDFIHDIIMLSQQFNFLIVVDEIQTGLMRTGTFFCYEQFNITPDILTVAKSLGGGLPLGAMIVSKQLEHIFMVGDHGSTFGGNPVCCAAGNACIKQLLTLKSEINKKSEYLISELSKLKEEFPHVIKEIRGLGLMLGIDVGKYAVVIQNKALEKGLLLNITNKSIIRLLPPLNIRLSSLNKFIKIYTQILKEIGDGNEF